MYYILYIERYLSFSYYVYSFYSIEMCCATRLLYLYFCRLRVRTFVGYAFGRVYALNNVTLRCQYSRMPHARSFWRRLLRFVPLLACCCCCARVPHIRIARIPHPAAGRALAVCKNVCTYMYVLHAVCNSVCT
jgi:hypothetical protein